MIILLIAVSLVAYVIIGTIAARALRSQIIRTHTWVAGERYRDRWNDWKTVKETWIDRDSVKVLTWQMILGWPIFSWVLMINDHLEAALNEVDPVVQKRKLEEQQKRINELERELRIGR